MSTMDPLRKLWFSVRDEVMRGQYMEFVWQELGSEIADVVRAPQIDSREEFSSVFLQLLSQVWLPPGI